MKQARPLEAQECVRSSLSVCGNVRETDTGCMPMMQAQGNICKFDPPKLRLLGNVGVIKGRSKTPGGREIQAAREQTGDEVFTGDIEDYLVGPSIGQGAYATVKLSVHKATSSQVAIKVYDKAKMMEPHRRRNLLREVEILKKLDHPNCVKMLEAISAPKGIFLVMEYVPGESLHAYIQRKPFKKLEDAEARTVFGQVVAGLEYCHGLSISHRDIKLENVIIDTQNRVKIIDFGFSTLTEAEERTKVFCGTPSYMAPEIVQRKEFLGAAADLWALGVLLYTLLSGIFPFRGLTDKELYAKIAKGIFSFPHCIPQSARTLIQSLLSVDPGRRPTCSQILQHSWVVNSTAVLGSTSLNKPKTLQVSAKNEAAAQDKRSTLAELFQKYQIFRKPDGGFTYTKLHSERARGKENRS